MDKKTSEIALVGKEWKIQYNFDVQLALRKLASTYFILLHTACRFLEVTRPLLFCFAFSW